jgi:hypothetical protein
VHCTVKGDIGPPVVVIHELRSSPERVKDGTPSHQRDFALLQPLDERLHISPILVALLKVIDNTSFAFIDLSQDETRVIGWGRVGICRVRKLWTLGHVVAQESFLPITVVRGLHPRPMAFKNSVTFCNLIRRRNNDEGNLTLVVVFHSRFSEV